MRKTQRKKKGSAGTSETAKLDRPRRAAAGRFSEDLPAKVKALREQWPSKAEFARDLRVARTQINAWEKGTERPSNEKLLDMAKLAASREDRSWFLSAAGVDLQAVAALISDEVASTLRSYASGQIAVVPVIKRYRLDAQGAPAARESEGELQISAERLPPGAILTAVTVGPELARFGGPPTPLKLGDLLIIDRSRIYPEDFFEGTFSPQSDRICALLVPELPEHSGRFTPKAEISRQQRETPKFDRDRADRIDRFHREQDPELYARQKESEEALARDIELDFKSPNLLFGYLSEQRSSGDADEIFPGENYWRLIFLLRGLVVPLTEWQKDTVPGTLANRVFLNGASIFGEAIGWISQQRLVSAAPDARDGQPGESK